MAVHDPVPSLQSIIMAWLVIMYGTDSMAWLVIMYGADTE